MRSNVFEVPSYGTVGAVFKTLTARRLYTTFNKDKQEIYNDIST